MKVPIIIAEVGVNHNGKLAIAKKLIAKAALAGADYVKFQTYKTESLVSKKASTAEYQSKTLKKKVNQYQMLKNYELSLESHKKLIRECKKNKIKFISSPFDIESIKLLIKLKLEIIKVPSGEINNIPYLKYLGKFNKKIILSTGMSTLKEIKEALKILIISGTNKKNISILHCTSEYPTSYENANLSTISFLKKNFNCLIGFSDHTIGNLASITAVNLGAEIIEKHITLNNKMRGPDHIASLNIKELPNFIKQLKSVNKLYGSKKKIRTLDEKKNSLHIRKSIFAKINILKGEKLTEKNLITLRPGKYISASKWKKILNKKAIFNFKVGDPIKV
ncbi:N-acetylneuraminate synthase [bacterium]|jgi:N,N'-diacetyllegionaminate synthase|nr:N-acetylneuraminate synthase [bacterium]